MAYFKPSQTKFWRDEVGLCNMYILGFDNWNLGDTAQNVKNVFLRKFAIISKAYKMG